MAFRIILVILALTVVTLGALTIGNRAPSSTPALRTAIAPPQPRPLASFELVDQRGQRFGRETLTGRFSLLVIGFSQCPDICPATLVQLDMLDTRLSRAGAGVQTVFVSVDVERDTPEGLAEFLAYFNPRFVGVTGDKTQVDRLCDSLGLTYVKIPGHAGRYTVDHSAAVVLVDPQARVAGYFRPPLDVDAMYADLQALVGIAP